MKKKYCYATAIALLGLVACSDDVEVAGGGTNNGGIVTMNGRIPLTFNLNGLGSGSVPYSRAGEIALAGEKEIRTLDVYVFGKDTLPDGTEKTDGKMLLEEVFRSGVGDGITLDQSGVVTQAKLSVMGNNRKRLYFVANGRDQEMLNKFELGQTDTLAFRDGLTDALTGHIACPLLMTTSMGLSVKDSLAAKPAWDGRIDITLKRRVARFDIVNTGEDSQFFIEWIQQMNARKQNYLFEDVLHTTPYYEASELWDPERIDFKSLDNANNGEVLAAFYVYAAPAEEATPNTAKDFSLVLGGKTGSTGQGTAALYPVLMRTKQDDATTKLEVKANNRYVINIKSVGSNVITANIEVLDWIEGDIVSEHSGYGTFGLSMPATAPKGTMVTNTLTLDAAIATADIVVNVAVTSEWIAETDCDWIDLTGGTPAAGTVGKTLTFATTKANPRNDKSRVGKIVFRNKMRPSITQTLLVEQPKNESGTYLNVDMPSGITGLSVLGDTLTLPGYGMAVEFPIDGTNAASVTCTPTGTAIASAVFTADKNAIVVTMNENKSGKDVEGTLTIEDTTGDLQQTFRVVQKSQSLGIIQLIGDGISDHVLTLAAGTYEKTITVQANSAWTFDEDADPSDGYMKDWITLSDVTGSGSGDGSFKLAAAANTTFDAREINIKVVNTQKEGIFYMLTIKQAAKTETISVAGTGLSDNTLSMAQDATAAVTLTVTADLKDGDWELVDAGTTVGDGGWLTLGTKSSNEFTVTPTANDTGAARSVAITVQKTDGSLQQVITVTQAEI